MSSVGQPTLEQLRRIGQAEAFSLVPRDLTFERTVAVLEAEMPPMRARADQLLQVATGQRKISYNTWETRLLWQIRRYQRAWPVFEAWLDIPKLTGDLDWIAKAIGFLLLISLGTALLSVVTTSIGLFDWVNTLVGVAFFVPLIVAAWKFRESLGIIKRLIVPKD